MIAATFWHTWIWPAGGDGGTVGDVVASVEYSLVVAVVAVLLWPKVRHAIERFAKAHVEELKAHVTAHHELAAQQLAEVHRKLDDLLSRIDAGPPEDDGSKS